MRMPQYEFMLIFVVVVVVIALRRVIATLVREAKRAQETGQAYRRAQTTTPAPFQEAAPYQLPPQRQAQTPDPRAQMRPADKPEASKITKEDLEQERDKRAAERRIITPKKSAVPRPEVMPRLNGASLVQAVITKEILTRPPSARRPYKGWNRRQNL